MSATKQMQIFDSGVLCAHCGKDPGFSEPAHWEGFYDADTGAKVCDACRNIHYQKKALGIHKGKFSEMPVIIAGVYEFPAKKVNFSKKVKHI